jgi:hypothetical protein
MTRSGSIPEALFVQPLLTMRDCEEEGGEEKCPGMGVEEGREKPWSRGRAEEEGRWRVWRSRHKRTVWPLPWGSTSVSQCTVLLISEDLIKITGSIPLLRGQSYGLAYILIFTFRK